MIIFTKESSWFDFIDTAFKLAVRQTGNPNESDCDSISYARTLGDISCETAFKLLQSEEVNEGWLLWVAMNMWDHMDDYLRLELINIIARDPPSASVLYVKLEKLSDEHDMILWNSFSGNMPTVTNAIRTGKTARAKK